MRQRWTAMPTPDQTGINCEVVIHVFLGSSIACEPASVEHFNESAFLKTSPGEVAPNRVKAREMSSMAR